MNNDFKIFYGVKDECIDVTDICWKDCRYGDYIMIPPIDHKRTAKFTDPFPNILKSIFIHGTEYDVHQQILINIQKHQVVAIDIRHNNNDDNIKNNEKLEQLHKRLTIKHGSFSEELPEQMMAIRYLKGHEKVLEIGGNVGRNSMIISSILAEKQNYDVVVLESDTEVALQLTENRDLNHLLFHIEPSALSKRKLIQKGWDTKPSDVLEDEHHWVPTITLSELYSKYKIDFDTLIVDCEGAFYYILMDMPEILDNIKLIIMENDYHYMNHKNYVDDMLSKNGFYVDYTESGGWGPSCPCSSFFFETWKKLDLV